MRRLSWSVLALCGLNMTACYSGISTAADSADASGGETADPSDDDGGDSSGGDSDTGEDPPPPACVGGDVGESQTHRLTRTEYDRAVRMLLGEGTPLESERLGFSDGSVGPFAHNAKKPVAEETVEDYQALAEAAADDAATRLDEVVECSIEAFDCPDQFIASFGRSAYRRTLTDDEHERLRAVFDLGAQTELSEGYRLVIAAVLQSPHFLYRVELGDGEAPDGLITLTSVEMASRLSFFLHGSPPDATLLDAAEAGLLDTPEGIEETVRDMLDDPRAREIIGSFPSQWLGVARTESLERAAPYSDVFDDELWAQMRAEVQEFGADVLFDGDARLQTLLTARHTFVTPDLAELYDVAVESDGWSRVELDPEKRSGVLTSAAFLAVTAHPDQTSPVLRGAIVRENLFCDEPPPPPPGVDDTPPAIDPTLPTRERFDQHRTDPACAGCHVLMDPIGYGFENYDPIGRFRETENGFLVDASGEIALTPNSNGTFDDAIDLIDQLAASTDVARCVQTQVFRWGNGRDPQAADECGQEHIYAAFAESDYDIRELIVALTISDAFRYRRVAEMENENEDEDHEDE